MKKQLLLITFLSIGYTTIFAQDLIVKGSLGIGVSIPAKPNFGFDTFIMEENNLRMFFNDNSSSGTFPSNDWRFTFNDTSNGGSNYFSIDDATGGTVPFRIDAGAPNNALRITDNGKIGIGTSNPGSIELNILDNDTPTIRLAQNGDFGTQSWDVAANETNFFVRDVTNGDKLPFKIQPTSPTNTLTIGKNGNIGVGFGAGGFPSINANASIHMKATDKGLLMNRMTTDQRTTFASSLGTEENGMMVYDSDENKVYTWNGTVWITDTDAQDLDLTDNTLSLTNDASTVDLTKYLDNTDDQTIDTFQLNGNDLELSLENDGVAAQTVNLSAYLDNTDTQTLSFSNGSLSITGGNSIDLSAYINTDTQDLTSASLSGTNLTIEIENGNAVTVDLSSILDPIQEENTAQQAQIDNLINRLEAMEKSVVSQVQLNKTNVPILYQNIPNPFNGTSTIKYYLPDGIANASILFSDMVGKVFSTVSLKETGDGELNINSDGLATGTYFYTLYVGSRKIDTKKMVIE